MVITWSWMVTYQNTWSFVAALVMTLECWWVRMQLAEERLRQHEWSMTRKKTAELIERTKDRKKETERRKEGTIDGQKDIRQEGKKEWRGENNSNFAQSFWNVSDLRSLRASLEQNAVAPAPAGPAEPLPLLDLQPQGERAWEIHPSENGKQPCDVVWAFCTWGTWNKRKLCKPVLLEEVLQEPSVPAAGHRKLDSTFMWRHRQLLVLLLWLSNSCEWWSDTSRSPRSSWWAAGTGCLVVGSFLFRMLIWQNLAGWLQVFGVFLRVQAWKVGWCSCTVQCTVRSFSDLVIERLCILCQVLMGESQSHQYSHCRKT